jgi:16S rRNA (cytosine967-C5)-methyltransferase
VLKSWGQAHRYAGSKDRRAIADRVYRALRNRARLAWAAGEESGRALVLFSLALLDGLGVEEIEALYTGAGYGPGPLSEAERGRLAASAGSAAGLGHGGPAGVRGRGLPATVRRRVGGGGRGSDGAARADRPAGQRPEGGPGRGAGGPAHGGPRARAVAAVRLGRAPLAEPPPNVQKLEAFRDGRVEIQDEGSQLAAWLARAQPGETVVDFCAGGGGKTLALAQDMAGEGRLVACDVEARRVEAIRPRLARAGLQADLRVLGPEAAEVEDLREAADLVFVDAPCSGSGTWRRRPETAWRLTGEEVERLHALQVEILGRAARLVRPGGRLAYITCSVLGRENEDSAAALRPRA